LHPEIITIDSAPHVIALATEADYLRKYLLANGVVSAPPEHCEGTCRRFRLGATARLPLVRLLLMRWAAAGRERKFR
jgi:hypothetical protein